MCPVQDRRRTSCLRELLRSTSARASLGKSIGNPSTDGCAVHPPTAPDEPPAADEADVLLDTVKLYREESKAARDKVEGVLAQYRANTSTMLALATAAVAFFGFSTGPRQQVWYIVAMAAYLGGPIAAGIAAVVLGIGCAALARKNVVAPPFGTSRSRAVCSAA